MHLRKFQILAQISRRRNIHHMRDTPHAAAGRGNEPAASGPLKAVAAPDRHCTWIVTGSLTALGAFFRLNCAVYVPRSTFGSLL